MLIYFFKYVAKEVKISTRAGSLPIDKGLMNVFRQETNLISREMKPPLRYIQILFEIISFIF